MILLLVLAALSVGLVPFEKVYDDGLWPLAVTVRSAASAPITAATGQAFGDAKEAAYVLEHLAPPETRLYAATEDPFRGKELTVNVPTSWTVHRSLLREYRSYYQYGKKLVVLVRYEGDKQEGRLVDIPDLRQTRELTVEVP